ncbi:MULTISPECIES: hypothetical protein [unclassified Roseovarius]|uniref:hypothetical protein n=1 Tax=unclassified Roseovarius TaxID=2614913 RepID=UPI00273DE25B|nr:hypothetical protein [Roseovarius sp. MMSF_3350]
MRSQLLKLLPCLALAALAGCTEVPDDGNSQSFASSRNAPAPSSLPPGALTEAISMPDAVWQRSAQLARYGHRFDKAFYQAAAQREAANIAALKQAFLDLGPGVDPEEAGRAAYVAYTYVAQLVVEYEIDSGPLAHNTAVNFGNKPRGLCWHWAHDMDARLQRENFKTLEIHRAIANYDSIRLEHSTTILGRRGDTMEDSLVLDPWRDAGDLYWSLVREDGRYDWTERSEVFAWKKAQKAKQTGTPAF